MTVSATDLHRLDVLLDTLLPGGSGFPPASTVDLSGWIADRSEYDAVVQATLALLSPDFPTLEPAQRDAGVRALEANHKQAFEGFVAAAYAGYYTSLPVLAVIEAATGYHARPQPFGYALAPFDAAILAVPAQAPRSWRDLPSS